LLTVSYPCPWNGLGRGGGAGQDGIVCVGSVRVRMCLRNLRSRLPGRYHSRRARPAVARDVAHGARSCTQGGCCLFVTVPRCARRCTRRLLELYHGLPEDSVRHVADLLRTYGVRMDNAEKNTGKRAYCFNNLQRALFPQEYRCPPGTGGGGHS
jgi:hypothetical protein